MHLIGWDCAVDARKKEALGNLEKFLHERGNLPELVHCALVHAQFETVHPFLDGNGRVGRPLITLLLCEREILRRPLLYLSYYLKAHRAEYYDRLTAIRNSGDWEGWVMFFLRGVRRERMSLLAGGAMCTNGAISAAASGGCSSITMRTCI